MAWRVLAVTRWYVVYELASFSGSQQNKAPVCFDFSQTRVWFFHQKLLITLRSSNLNPLPSHGQAPSWSDLLPQAGGHCYRPSLREVWRQVRHLRFPGATVNVGANLRRVQLRLLPGSMCRLWGPWSQWRLLLQGVHHSREGPRRLSEDCQPGLGQDGSVLWAEKVRFQEKVTSVWQVLSWVSSSLINVCVSFCFVLMLSHTLSLFVFSAHIDCCAFILTWKYIDLLTSVQHLSFNCCYLTSKLNHQTLTPIHLFIVIYQSESSGDYFLFFPMR